MTRRFPDKRLTLAQLQAAMNLHKPAEGFAHKPAFMDLTPRKPRAEVVKNKHPEEELQIVCCQYLDQMPRILYWATPNSTWVGEMTGAKMGYLAKQKRLGVKRGIPDLSLFFRNRHGQPTFCFAELKSKKGVTSEEQENYMDKCNDRGGYSAVVKSIDDLKNLLELAQY